MVKTIQGTCLVLLAAAGGSAQTQVTTVDNGGAYLYYSRDDHVVGGKQVSLNVSVSPAWPPGSPLRIQYFTQECTIDYCWEMSPGYVWCNCAPFSGFSASGTGQLPDGAFDVSPQGRAHLALDTAQATWSASWGSCDRLDLTWVPTGASHLSQDGKIRFESPTEVDQGVSHDDYWQAGVTGTVCGLALTSAESVFTASVQKSHWVNMTRTPKP